VVKIEPPGRGEAMRSYDPKWGADSVNFALLNRGKTSLGLDLKTDAGRDRALALAAQSDVLVEQFRPGVMDRLGLGYEAVRRVNPKIIYCAITGYGQTGPKRQRAGHDLNYLGDTGLLALSTGEPGHRVVPPALIADIAGGAYPAVMNVLLALRQRDLTGEGAYIDVAMAENVLAFAYWGLGNGLAAGQWPGNGTDLVTGGTPRYRLYDTADRKVVAVAALEQKFWDAFTEAIGLDQPLRDDTRDGAATTRRIQEIIASRTADQWEPIFHAADCCCTIVKSLHQAIEDPHFVERGVFAHGVTNSEGQRLPALPVPIDKSFREACGDRPAPRLREAGTVK
jgi:alpha-methylacyl-CoA racemase